MKIRYFVLNSKSQTAHAYGCCQQTKPRAVPIRLFDTQEELEAYAGRPLKLCKACSRQLKKRT